MTHNMDQEPRFLLALAAEYMKQSLLDHALDILAKISTTDEEAYHTAQSLSLRIHFLKKDFPRVIYLAEAFGGAEKLHPGLARDLATAYWNSGAKAMARQALKIASAYLPEISVVKEFLESIPSDQINRKLPDPAELLEKSLQYYLGYHFALDNLSPLIYGVRSATCGFYDQIPLLARVEELPDNELKEGYLSLVGLLYREFNVITVFGPYFIHSGIPLIKLYFSKNFDIFARVQEIESHFWAEATPWPEGLGWDRYLEEEASFLGYPECCSREIKNLRAQQKSYELEAKAKLIRQSLKSAFCPDLPPPMDAFFAFEFFPCNPKCVAAETIGRHIAQRYQEASPWLGQIYKEAIIPLNKGIVFNSGMPYHNFIQGFDDHIESLLGELGEKLASYRKQRGIEDKPQG